MKPRLDYGKVAPQAVQAMYGLEKCVSESGLEASLLELVRLRASQINGCAYCLDMHSKDARARGESEQRLHSVVVWRETSFFSERERAALTWTEVVTQISSQDIPDEVYELARRQFGEKELVDLTLAIVAINGWNRLAISFRKAPGTYQPKSQSAGTAKTIHLNGTPGTAVSDTVSTGR